MRKGFAALPLVLLLAGCGGGGGGGGGAPATNSTGSGDAEPVRGAQVSGTAQAVASTAHDSDVNDPEAPYTANDSADQAQSLPNPVLLGGFASAAGTGVAGDRFQAEADRVDVFSLYLTRGQTVKLTISDFRADAPAAVDLDLYLYAAHDRDTVVASSLGQQKTESLSVPETGDYLLAVRAVAGASNYLLAVGEGGLDGANRTLRLEDDFVPGEVVVRFRQNDRRRSAQSMGVRLPQGLRVARSGPGGTALLQVEESTGDAGLGALGVDPGASVARGLGPAGAAQRLKHDTLRAVKALRRDSAVLAAAPNYQRQALLTPTDPYYQLQWHYPLIQLPEAWNVTRGSAEVVVAVIDTGTYLEHPDLAANLVEDGYDFISDADRALDGDGIDPNADDPGDGGSSGASSYHGTHVAGLIGAVSDNEEGVVGVAHRVGVLPLRVLGEGGGTSYDLMQALRYAAGLDNDAGTTPRRRADIINLSLGGAGYSQVEQDLFSELHASGIIVVAAAGNDGGDTPVYPAAYDGVVAVSAVDYDKRRAPYSNTGSYVDVAAPGGNAANDSNADGNPDAVLSTLVREGADGRSGDYRFYQGTSVAAPHVAGVAALMKALYPQMTARDFDAALASGSLTEDLRGDGPSRRNDDFGYGLIDAFKAVSVANDLAAGGTLPPVLAVTPERLQFGPGDARHTLSVHNAGGGELAIRSVSDDAEWLTVEAVEVGADGLGDYRVSVDRTGLADASYPATISFTADNGDLLELPVTLQVGGYAVGDTGRLYLLLMDADSGEVVQQLAVQPASGRYEFHFQDVAAGDYFLVAGSDNDNDRAVCDPGEACGAWPAAGEPARFSVGAADRSGLNFETAYRAGPGAEGGPVPARSSTAGVGPAPR